MNIQTKRVYEQANQGDGFRVLVDRVWPRGMTKERARADLWLKDVAPSTDLRKWFAHDRTKWAEFKRRYVAELKANPEAVAKLLDKVAEGQLTLLFSAQDAECNQAVVLKEYLASHSRKA